MYKQKFRITKKELNQRFNTVCVPYTSTTELLSTEFADYYTTRAEGWGMDVYVYYVDGVTGAVALCTGYDTIGGKIPQRVRDICSKYEKKAKNLEFKLSLHSRYNYKYYNYRRTMHNKWIKQMLKEILEG